MFKAVLVLSTFPGAKAVVVDAIRAAMRRESFMLIAGASVVLCIINMGISR